MTFHRGRRSGWRFGGAVAAAAIAGGVGCVAERPAAAPPTGAARAAGPGAQGGDEGRGPAGPGTARADVEELEGLAQQLRRDLAAVERRLLALGPDGDLAGWERLANQRLRLSVALLRVERALALGVPLVLREPAASDGDAQAEVPLPVPPDRRQRAAASPALERVLEDADRRVAEARLASRPTGSSGEEREEGRGRWGLEKTSGADDESPYEGGLLPGGGRPAATPTTPTSPKAAPPDESLAPAEDRGGRKAAVVRPAGVPANVMPAVEPHLGPLLRCFPAELRRADPIALRVRTLLGADGAFRQTTVEADVELPPLVAACVTDELARVRVPPPDGGARVISFPLWLRAP